MDVVTVPLLDTLAMIKREGCKPFAQVLRTSAEIKDLLDFGLVSVQMICYLTPAGRKSGKYEQKVWRFTATHSDQLFPDSLGEAIDAGHVRVKAAFIITDAGQQFLS